MSFRLSAPYPGTTVIVTMPSPRFGDGKAREQSMKILQSMDGSETYTYVKSSDRVTMTLPFTLSRMKALEVREFLRIYYRAPMKLEMPDGSVWSGSFVSGSPVLTSAARAGGWPGGEIVDVELEFSVVQLTAPTRSC